MRRVRAFVEAPAGLAAVSLRLHGGPHCRPPISRCGNKAGYAEVILAALGLRSGQGAGAYVWCEADADVRGLLRAYPDAAMLRRVAEIIRGWADEEPRALWERLRAERRARGPRVDEEGTAGWIAAGALTHGGADARGPQRWAFNDKIEQGTSWARGIPGALSDVHRLAEYATITSSNRLIHVADDGTGDLRNTGQGGTTFGGAEFATPAGDVAAAFERAAEVGAFVVEHAGTHPGGADFRGLHKNRPNVDGFIPSREGLAEAFERVAGEVAAHAFVHQGSFQYKGEDAGIGRPEGMEGHDTHGAIRPVRDILGDAFPRVAIGRWPPVAVLPTIPTAADLAALLGTPGDLEGVVVYADPDYRGTTGYASTCRDLIPDFARACDALGAVVCISEQEPLPELPGWHAVEITAGRRGQKRTFSKQQGEWLTMNREPAHRVATQSPLFALGGP